MAVSKTKKNEILQELVEKIKNAKSISFSETNGMSVSDFFELRKELRTVDTSYHIAKKTLIKLALKEALDMDIDVKKLSGQIGITFSNSDAIAGLSKVNDFMKKTEDKKQKIQKITWVACIFDGEFKEKEETMIIASMPSRETLLSRLVGSLQSPISGLARFFDGASKKLESEGKNVLGELEGEKSNNETNSQEEVKEEEKEEK